MGLYDKVSKEIEGLEQKAQRAQQSGGANQQLAKLAQETMAEFLSEKSAQAEILK